MKKYIIMTLVSTMFVSCLDTVILPDHLTVDEDFWKSKDDVSSMVNAAYSQFASADVITSMIIWGDFRSGELVQSPQTLSLGNNTTSLALQEISSVSMQTTNMYATWATFYSVINRCIIVLEKAEAVQNEDPNYTKGDYNADRSQMLALRSLCYFYLVRAFRDVPYIDKAYLNSSQETKLAQSSPEYVLGRCIADLEEAKKAPLSSRSYRVSEWRRVGWMTEDAINSLLADIYLWRGSVKHDAADYQRCADLCADVIASKKLQHVLRRGESSATEYWLSPANRFYAELFVDCNAEESIFEIQTGKTGSNTAVKNYYYAYNGNASSKGWLMAASYFGNQSTDVNTIGTNVYAQKDMRYYTSTFLPSSGGSEPSYDIRKFVSANGVTSESKQQRKVTDPTSCKNFIIYRLPDVMLMRAEALVQLSSATGDIQHEQAFNLVREVHGRALLNPASDSIKWATFKTYDKTKMENLVLGERHRELCFEGKRWFDLLRFAYRHMDGVDYNHTFGELMGTNASYTGVPIYKDMLELMTRGRGSDAIGIQGKMQGETFLYMPIPQRDIELCPLLKQNPAYKNSTGYSKTY